MAITDFSIETAPSLSGLKSSVAAAIAAGWQPYNAVSFVDGKYIQQLIKGEGTITEIDYMQAMTPSALSSSIAAAMAAGFDPFGEIVSLNRQAVATMVKGTPPGSGAAAVEALEVDVSGAASTGLSYKFGDYNYAHADTEASFMFGGTATQPNYIGKKNHRQVFPGDGTTGPFVVTAPFVVEDTTRFNIRAKKRRLTDGAVFIYSEGSGFTVTAGYGTATVTVTTTAAVALTTEELEVTIISLEDDATADPQLITIGGYDNVVNSIMSVCFAAHCVIYPGNGHNSILGGSFHRIAGSYNTIIAGTSCDIGLVDSASFGCAAFGQSVRVDGSQSFGFGANIQVRGTASGYFGRNGRVSNFSDSFGFGYGAAPTAPSQIATGFGKSTDAGVAGLRQHIATGLSIDTTTATQTYFTNSSGSSEVTIPPDSAQLIQVDVVALRDDNTQAQGFSGQFLVTRVGSAIPAVDGSIADVVVPSVKSFGSAAWVCNIRGIVDGIRLRATGEAAKNIRWVGRISLVQTVY